MIGSGKGVGLYADPRKVYAVHLSKQVGRIGLLGESEADIAQNGDGPADAKALAEALKLVVAKAGIQQRDVAAAVPGKDAIIRYFEMPLIPKKEWHDAIRFEAQKYMSLSTDDLYFNYNAIPHKSESKLEVVFLASPKDTVGRLVSLYFDARLNMQSLEPVAFSLLRAFRHERSLKAEDVHALIDVHNDGVVNILIERNGILLMARDSVILKGIGEGLDSERAPDFRALMTEIDLSFNYFFKHFVNEEIKTVYVAFDTLPVFKDWDRRLAAELGLPVESGVMKGIFAPESPHTPGRMIAAGLALRDMGGASERYTNLIPADIAKTTRKVLETQTASRAARPTAAVIGEDDSSSLKKWAAIVFAASAALVFGIYLTTQITIGKLSAETQKLKARMPQLATVPDPNTDVPGLKGAETRLSAQQDYLSQLIDKRQYWTEKLSRIAALIPPNMELDQMDAYDSTAKTGRSTVSVKLDGKIYAQPGADMLEQINRVAEALRKDKIFMRSLSEVRITSARRNADDTAFTIDCISAEKR